MSQIKGHEITHKMIARFRANVDERPNGCWEWQRSKDKNGYGYFSVKGKTVKAHRFSYAAYNGELPEGLLVLHRCDNPGCVNPAHLWLGTDADNIKDRDQKERGKFPFKEGDQHLFRLKPELGDRKRWKPRSPEKTARGEAAGGHKITEEEALAIRHMRNHQGLTLKEIADIVKIISFQQVSRIAKGKSWEHLKDKACPFCPTHKNLNDPIIRNGEKRK